MRPNIGDLVGNKYRVARLIGDGGMGVVYEARHEVLGTAVALKFLHAELARRPGLASRFVQEAKVSASIQSPHVTRVTDVDSMPDGLPYMVMELLTGESLQQLLDRRRKLPVEQAVDFAIQIASGLEAAHALGVVHRDLKPDNVFITPSPSGPLLKLLDFGIAKLRESSEYKKGLTRPGAIMGTPEYMAPEQLYAADRVDHRADLYSLGVLLYEMLTGERPANGDDAQQIVGQVIAGKVKPITEYDPSFSEALAQAVHRALQPDKTLRFASAAEMRQTLASLGGRGSIGARASDALRLAAPLGRQREHGKGAASIVSTGCRALRPRSCGGQPVRAAARTARRAVQRAAATREIRPRGYGDRGAPARDPAECRGNRLAPTLEKGALATPGGRAGEPSGDHADATRRAAGAASHARHGCLSAEAERATRAPEQAAR